MPCDLEAIGCFPDHIDVGGVAVPVETDFRAWLRFSRLLEDAGAWDYTVMLEEPPEGEDWHAPALAFLRDEPKYPKRGNREPKRALDWREDGGLVYAALRQAYGIDLADPGLSMHWHAFLALVRYVPDSTMLARVGGWRSWEPGRKGRSEEAVMRERQSAWALEDRHAESDEDLVAMQMAWFGGAGQADQEG